MGEATDKLKAAGNKLAGNVKESIGKATDNASLEAEGKAQKVKGAGQTLKRGTVIKSIRLTGDDQEIDCRYEGIKGLVLRAEFVRKS